MNNYQSLYCFACGAALIENAKFCSQCGKQVAPTSPRLKISYPLLIGSALVIGVGISYLSTHLIGKKPSQTHATNMGMNEPHSAPGSDRVAATDPEILHLQEVVAKDPNDIQALRSLSKAIWNKLVDIPNPPAGMILDLVDSLGALLKLEPQDDQALLMMANLSFNQKVFDKSADYFARYLAIKNDDHEARSSYASTLTFLGKYNEALRELDKVLKQHPDYFQAIAYKAITFAQLGKKEEAIALGQKALGLSPNEDAKARFAGFLDSLKSDENSLSAPRTPSRDDGATNFVRNHQIAGPKFVSGTLNPDGSVVIKLKEFPMSAMPPMVKESFLSKLKSAAKADTRIKSVKLIDADSGETLSSLDVAAQ